MRLGYTNVVRYPAGYIAWREAYPDLQVCEARTHRLQPGQYFPPCVLTAGERGPDFAYLGLEQESANFFLADVPTEFVLLKYYGEHCYQCVQEVDEYNRLFSMLRDDPVLGTRMKMIGIGVGDNQRSVLRFKRSHEIPYPLLPDERQLMFESVGAGEIPLIYLVRILPDARIQVVLYHEGGLDDVEGLFQRIREAVEGSGE